MIRMKRQGRFGTNMKRFIHEHEEEIRRGLENGENPEDLLPLHREKLAWLQHERLIHLMVTLATLLAFLAVTGAFFLYPGLLLGLLFLALTAFLLAYMFHYFLLESSVQYWYLLWEEIRRSSGRG